MKKLTPEIIKYVSTLVSERTGVILGDRQSNMVESRLLRHIRDLGLDSTQDYLSYLEKHREKETQHFLSLLTTHHTFFFREYEHFEHLSSEALPRLVAHLRRIGRKSIRVLSAACSKGHEVYSLAMYLKRHLPPDFSYEVVGGDICEESVDFARNGVYRWDEVKTIPAEFLNGNWIRGTGAISDFAKISESVKQHTKFESMNLIAFGQQKVSEKFDLILCRNVFIYFEREQVKSSVKGLLDRLHSHGELILGVSESLAGLELPLESIGPSVYRPASGEVLSPSRSVTRAAAPPIPSRPIAVSAPTAASPPVSVFAIDDSPTILKLVERLCRENGFQFLGSAPDGQKALQILTGPNAPKPSVITLDLHMPVMDGVDFLKAFDLKNQISVVVVSSVNREDLSLAQEALRLGARDYVEKPAMDRWAETTKELVAKIRAMSRAAQAGQLIQGPTEMDKAFAGSTTNIVRADVSRRWVILTNQENQARAIEFAEKNKSRISGLIILGHTGGSVKGLSCPVMGVPESQRWLETTKAREKCMMVIGDYTEEFRSVLMVSQASRILIEETTRSGIAAKALRELFKARFDMYPLQSFAYEADRRVQADANVAKRAA
ncbi:MAG: response regulator [Bdellovibrionales bacterium]|nr:response regulator [Bdellovibrionales bacterium]